MNLLIDTHILLWWLEDDSKLTTKARKLISDANNLIFISSAVLWEIYIKQSIGKLKLPKNFKDSLELQGFLNLDVKAAHTHEIRKLPFHHKDPFDRMLVAQAKVEQLILLTKDPIISEYDVENILV